MENIQHPTNGSVLISSTDAKKNKSRYFNVSELFRMMARNWMWFLLSVIVFLGAAAFYKSFLQPVYERVSDIEIVGIQAPQEDESSFLDLFNNNSADMDNELYVFHSLKLAREVAECLHLDVQYFEKGAFQDRYLYEDRPFVLSFHDQYQQDTKLCIRPTSAQTFLILFVEKDGVVQNLPDDVPPYFFGSPLKLPGSEEEIELTVSEQNYASLTSFVDKEVIVSRSSLDRAAERCQEMISAVRQTNTVVRITCRASSVKEADEILKTVTSVYNDLAVRERMDVIDSSAKFIEDRLEEAANSDTLFMSGKTLVLSQDYKKEYVQYLLRRREELMLQKTSFGVDTRIIEDPMGSEDPVAPVAKKIYLLFLAMGLLLPFVLMLISALLTTGVRGRNDLLEAMTIPLIGELPKANGEAETSRWREFKNRCLNRHDDEDDKYSTSSLLVSHEANTQLANAFHVLRSNLSFLGAGGSATALPQVMLFTSLTPGSGRSFVSANLASVLADDADSRCLWIDMDLYYKRQYNGLLKAEDTCEDLPGITSLLSGKAQLNECIRRCAGNENLDILLAGPIPPNPVQLLMSEQLDQLMASLRQTYKYIIINSSTSSHLVEASICNRFVDLTAFVIRVDRTRYGQLEEIEQVCQKQRLKNACSVLTCSDVSHYRLMHGYKTGTGYDYE